MSSPYTRSSGLVQRRTAAAHAVEASSEEQKGEQNYDDDNDQDSKETRLTLMEEVLLLGLKDREVLATLICEAWCVCCHQCSVTECTAS